MSVPWTLSDLESRDAKDQCFPEDLCNYAPTVRTRANKFAEVTLVGIGTGVLGVRHARVLRERGPAPPTFLGPILTPIGYGLT